jgi:hypothetical protein
MPLSRDICGRKHRLSAFGTCTFTYNTTLQLASEALDGTFGSWQFRS